MDIEDVVIYKLTKNLMNKSYVINFDKYVNIDWLILLKKTIAHRIFPHVYKYLVNVPQNNMKPLLAYA